LPVGRVGFSLHFFHQIVNGNNQIGQPFTTFRMLDSAFNDVLVFAADMTSTVSLEVIFNIS